jgi:hypothetical protein
VLEVKPDQNKSLLTIRWRYRNTSQKPLTVLAQSGPFRELKARPIDKFTRGTYFLKAGDNTTYRYSIVRDTGRKLWATPHIGLRKVVVKPGGQMVFWAKFNLPKDRSVKISLHLPDVEEPIEGLAIQMASRAVAGPASKREGDQPLATTKTENGLTVEVLEIKPDQNKSLLTIRWRYRNSTQKPLTVLAQSGALRELTPRPVDKFIRDTYFLKAGDNTTYRYFIVRDTGRKLWATPHIGLRKVVVKPGGHMIFWAKFGLPKDRSVKISLHLPDVEEPIEGLAIQK